MSNSQTGRGISTSYCEFHHQQSINAPIAGTQAFLEIEAQKTFDALCGLRALWWNLTIAKENTN
jgi:hypothetical protein